MKGMILVFLLLGSSLAQVSRTNNRFLRFDDSLEDDSDENVFGGARNRGGVQRSRFDDDSDERGIFRSPTNHFGAPQRQTFVAPVTNSNFGAANSNSGRPLPTQNRNAFVTPKPFVSQNRNSFGAQINNPFAPQNNRNAFSSTNRNNFVAPNRNPFTTSNRNSFDRFDDDKSDERFFVGTNAFATNLNNRNRFDDSREDNFRRTTNRSPFNSNSNRNRFDDSDEDISFRNRNRNTNTLKTKNRIDSVEDLFDDLFDNDLDDRVRAQNALSKLGFGNQGSNRGVSTSFNTRLGSDRVNNNIRATNNPILSSTNNFRSPFNNNLFQSTTARPLNSGFPSRSTSNINNKQFNPTDHFRLAPGTATANRFGSTNQFGTNNVRPQNNGAFSFGTSLGNPARFNTQHQSPSVSNTNRLNSFNTNGQFNNQRSNTVSEKRTFGVPLSNSIKSDPFSNVKRSEFFPNTPGFNWPGGNGYYVRMSTGNSKPVSYFVKYDD